MAVDMRKGSPAFGQSATACLSEENKNMLYVPEGFAHGFCAMSDDTEVVYFCSEEYDAQLERCVRWDDRSINIPWPIEKPVLSLKDLHGKLLAQADNNFIYKG